MRKLLLVPLALLALVGCEEPLVIKNDCFGSWVSVVDGDGDYLTYYLPYGSLVEVDLEEAPGTHVELLASGYRLGSDEPIGSTTTSRKVPQGGGVTAPPQMDPWVIRTLRAPSGMYAICRVPR